MNPTAPAYSPLNILFAVATVVLPTGCATSNSSEGANNQAPTIAIRAAAGQGTATSSSLHSELALTPPMGWNSWNAFEANIDEQKIRQIAGAIVSSGMKDAGYTYLVIDDGWMAKSRDRNGNLVADPNKFPTGMKAIGDYIHSKGLKFGIYEDRGHLTCQQLPGSFRHEQADITVHWDKIGLLGNQPVRDLWMREDLGEFKDSFTAHDLGQHEHRMIKVGRPGPPLPTAATMPLERYTVTRHGETYLSDLYYIWKADNAPAYDAAFGGDPITISGRTFKKGIGCKSKCAVMFKVDGRADRFRATVAMDKSSKEDTKGRFRVYDEDFFGNRVLWDSGEMRKDSPAKEIDIELKDVPCLMLVFDGDEVLGNWADARVISKSESDHR